MRTRIPVIPLLLLASCGVAFGSWIANLYGVGEVQSLLSAEGIRRECSVALAEYMACPELAILLVMAPGVGLCAGGGLFGALRRVFAGDLTRRERRALNWAVVAGVIGGALIASSVVGRWAFLRGVTGGFYPSPFLRGLPCMVSLSLALIGWMYGYAAGSFGGMDDIREALAGPLRRVALYPVYLFLLVRLFGQLHYTCLPEAVGIGEGAVDGAFHLLAVVLLGIALSNSRKRK